MPTARLTQKGQATIPKNIRDFLGIKPRDVIRFEISGDEVIIRPTQKTILDFKGAFRLDIPIKDFGKLREQVKKKVSEKIAGQ